MRASELIKYLAEAISDYGDREITCWDVTLEDPAECEGPEDYVLASDRCLMKITDFTAYPPDEADNIPTFALSVKEAQKQRHGPPPYDAATATGMYDHD